MSRRESENRQPVSDHASATDSSVLLGRRIGIALSVLITATGVVLGFGYGFGHVLFHDKSVPVTPLKVIIFGLAVTVVQFAFDLWARKRQPRSPEA